MSLLGTKIFAALKAHTQTILGEELPAAFRNLRGLSTKRLTPVTVIGGISGITRPPLIEVLVSPPVQTLPTQVKDALIRIDDSYQHLFKRHIDPLFGATRQQQIETMAEESERIAISSNEKALNRNIAISLVLTGTALIAGHALAPIVLVCFPLAIYISRVPLQRAYTCYFLSTALNCPGGRFHQLLRNLAGWLLLCWRIGVCHFLSGGKADLHHGG